MKKYILTSTMFTGAVVFGYNPEGRLILFENEAEFTDNQHAWLLSEKNFPKYVEDVESLRKVVKGDIKEIFPDLSFDVFWDAYDHKVNRKRCEPIYKKLTDAQKYQAISSIKPFEQYLARTGYRGKPDPDTYLRKTYFDTDWRKVQK